LAWRLGPIARSPPTLGTGATGRRARKQVEQQLEFCGMLGPSPVMQEAFGLIQRRGESPTAFGRRCIPSPPQRDCRVGDPGPGCVAPPSNIPDIATPPRKTRAAGAPVLGRHALPGVPSVAATLRAPAGRIASLGATQDF